MERVGVLINKLQEQLSQKADVQSMVITAQMLQAELLLHAPSNHTGTSTKVAVILPNNFVLPVAAPSVAAPAKATPVATNVQPLVPAVDATISSELAAFLKPVHKPEPEPVEVNEPEASPETPLPAPEPAPTPKPEPEPIPHFSEEKPWQRLFVNKEESVTSPWAVDPMIDIPTLAHQQHTPEKVVYELNEVMVAENTTSINDRLKHESAEVGLKLQDTPVKDLKKAISINDRHRFIHELFREDETMYERSVKTINGFQIFAEAEFWIQRELKVKLGWDTSLEIVKMFDQVVKRRFS